MEGAPYSPEYDLNEAESKKRKPKAETIGSFAVELDPSQRSSEHIGHLIIDAEARTKKMNRTELLEVGAKIEVDGSTLKQMYESHLIGERGLQRLIAEYMSGGDLEKALQREVLDREIDFERDPAMRDHIGSSDVSASGSSNALNDLLQKASASVGAGTEEIAFLKARANYHAKQQDEKGSRRRWVDVAMVGTILVLSTLVTILILTRR